MKTFKQSYVLVFVVLLGCHSSIINGQYHNIGGYKTRIQAQNGAIINILRNYDLLPNDTYYKVKYSVPSAPLTEQRENALWYNKSEGQLVYEIDVASGPVCRWRKVDKIVLEQASKSINSLSKIDSLAKPDQPFSECR